MWSLAFDSGTRAGTLQRKTPNNHLRVRGVGKLEPDELIPGKPPNLCMFVRLKIYRCARPCGDTIQRKRERFQRCSPTCRNLVDVRSKCPPVGRPDAQLLTKLANECVLRLLSYLDVPAKKSHTLAPTRALPRAIQGARAFRGQVSRQHIRAAQTPPVVADVAACRPFCRSPTAYSPRSCLSLTRPRCSGRSRSCS